MRELPEGTVTFVFTDVEGSTKLLDELGAARYAEALAEHRRIIRAAFATGVEVDTQGDAFFFAFSRAADALAACRRAIDDLAEGPIRIRIGVHTGEPLRTGDGYVGTDVHRAARIAAAAHGGQIVVSRSTRDLVPDEELHDLGGHRLKDLRAAERLYQLGPGRFPPLRSLYRTNLPVPARPLVGRERELAELAALVRDERRLVTLTGPGGSGKTRLAVQAAAELSEAFPDGIFFAALAAVAEPGRVPAALADAVGVREQAGYELLDVLREFFAEKRLLLVIDNVEHVIDASPVFADLLDAAPRLVVLATSREPLHLAAECAFPVDPLEEPAAVELFVSRARDTHASFDADAARETIAAICARIDCLPLAVELAAARVKLLGADALLTTLDRRLDVLRSERRDAPTRQKTLRATIEWSYDLLGETEQRVFAELSVFAGGCSLEAAQAVCETDFDVLGSLLDKSLLRRRDVDGSVRLWMLQTIQEFAAQVLERRDSAAGVRMRHLTFYAGLAERAAPELWRAQQLAWLRALELERPNLTAALAYGLRDAHDVETGARLAAALQDFWDIRGHFEEAGAWLEEALRHRSRLSPYATARVETGIACVIGRLDAPSTRIIELLVHAADVFNELGLPSEEARAIGHVAPWLVGSGAPDGRARAEAAVARARAAANAAGDDVSSFLACSAAAEVAFFSETAEALRLQEIAAELCEQRGDARNGSIALANLAESAAGVGDVARAEESLLRAARLAREMQDPVVLAYSLNMLATLRVLAGRCDEAVPLLSEAVRLTREHGAWALIDCLPCVALLAADPAAEAAARVLDAFERLAARPRATPVPQPTAAVFTRARSALPERSDSLGGAPPSPAAAFEDAARILADLPQHALLADA